MMRRKRQKRGMLVVAEDREGVEMMALGVEGERGELGAPWYWE